MTPYDAVGPGITKAITAAEAALAEKPDSRERHRALVQALSYAGELDRARDVAKQWLDRDQLDPQALGYLADVYGRGGDRERGLRTLAGLVDLDADKVALHDRMMKAYEQVGRLSQACAHRVAIASIQPKVDHDSAAALRCLRGLGRDKDAELIVRALPDDATRATSRRRAGRTRGRAGRRRSRHQGALGQRRRPRPHAADPRGLARLVDGRPHRHPHQRRHEQRPRGARREVPAARQLPRRDQPRQHRQEPSTARSRSSPPGTKRSIPFELTSDHRAIGRVAVTLHETFEDLDGNPVILYDGPDCKIIRDIEVR